MAEPGLRGDPFAVLGLPARPGLSDEDVRSAWRRIAAATHPDREDGGDPAVFGAAAAAYVTLRTDFGRGEALADLHEPVVTRLAGSGARLAAGAAVVASAAAGIAGAGRARGHAVRLAAAGAAVAVAFLAAGWSPGTAGVLAGALSWLVIAGLRS